MSSLYKAIKFRSFMDQLSKQEFSKFINKMFDHNKANLIKTSLFNHFAQSANNNDDQLNNINSILSNIIQSRKVKSKPLPTTNNKLDQLPLQIIGHTASFLDESSYFRLQKVNRSTAIGCNSPNKLMQLNLSYIKDYKSINLSKYRSLKRLEININKFHELVLPNNGQFIMNELDELILCGKRARDCDIEAFVMENCINIENIKTLRFCEFGDFGDFGDFGQNKEFNAGKFWRLLTKFRNIEYLELYGILLNDANIDRNKWKELYPDLKGLIVARVVGGYTMMNNRLVNILGNNLHFLEDWYGGHMNLKKVHFNKLQQLSLNQPDMNTINNILKSARNLQKVDIQQLTLYEDELKSVIHQILKNKSLEYFEIDTNDNKQCGSILEGIEFGLHETKKLERKQLKIRVGIKSVVDVKRAIFNITGIIFRLESSKINDFMFICDFKNVDKSTLNEKLNNKQILNDLKDISSNIEVKTDGLCFIITNKKCKINGWMEKWMM